LVNLKIFITYIFIFASETSFYNYKKITNSYILPIRKLIMTEISDSQLQLVIIL